MTTVPVLRQLDELRGQQIDYLKRQLRLMRRSKDIAMSPLFHNRNYLYLNKSTRNHPLAEVEKIRHYAMLLFCCQSTFRRKRLTAEDFITHFPDLYRQGRPLNYYMETSSKKPRLGFMRVDTGSEGRWDRIIAKARSDVCNHQALSHFQQLMRCGQFEVTILTTTPHKARRIENLVNKGEHSADSVIRAAAIPELLYLIAPPPDPNPVRQ